MLSGLCSTELRKTLHSLLVFLKFGLTYAWISRVAGRVPSYVLLAQVEVLYSPLFQEKLRGASPHHFGLVEVGFGWSMGNEPAADLKPKAAWRSVAVKVAPQPENGEIRLVTWILDVIPRWFYKLSHNMQSTTLGLVNLHRPNPCYIYVQNLSGLSS